MGLKSVFFVNPVSINPLSAIEVIHKTRICEFECFTLVIAFIEEVAIDRCIDEPSLCESASERLEWTMRGKTGKGGGPNKPYDIGKSLASI